MKFGDPAPAFLPILRGWFSAALSHFVTSSELLHRHSFSESFQRGDSEKGFQCERRGGGLLGVGMFIVVDVDTVGPMLIFLEHFQPLVR